MAEQISKTEISDDVEGLTSGVNEIVKNPVFNEAHPSFQNQIRTMFEFLHFYPRGKEVIKIMNDKLETAKKEKWGAEKITEELRVVINETLGCKIEPIIDNAKNIEPEDTGIACSC